jgi:Zn finger protein HypA/HybF involved in hydrogenase expression
MQSKEYKLPNGKTAVFEYDVYGIGKVTLESMDELMSMIADRPQGEWKRRLVDNGFNADWICSECGYRVKTDFVSFNYCPNCGARMKGATDGNQ